MFCRGQRVNAFWERVLETAIKCGILGLGQVARVRHVEAYRRDERCEVVAAFDPDPDKIHLAKSLGIPFFTTDLEAFWAESTDVVSVCSPPFAHKECVLAAFSAGRHVLVEKPMSMTSADCLALGRAAEVMGLKLCVAHNFLWGRGMRLAREALASGNVGEVTGVTAVQWSSWNRDIPDWHPDLPGGLFFDEIPHFLYLMEDLLGPLTVQNAWSNQGGPDGRRNEWRVDATLKGPKGFGSLTAWFGAPQSEWYIAIGCTRGTIVLDLFRDIGVILPPEDKRDYRYILEVPTRATAQRWSRIGQWIAKRVFKGRHLYGHERLISEFIDAVIDDGPVPVTAKEGARVLKQMESLLEMAGIGTE